MSSTSDKIRANPKFMELVKKRNSYAFFLSIGMLVVYYGFILLIAYDKTFLAQKLADGYVTSLGIPLGLGVILFTILVTIIYVRRANSEFDMLNNEIVAEAKN